MLEKSRVAMRDAVWVIRRTDALCVIQLYKGILFILSLAPAAIWFNIVFKSQTEQILLWSFKHIKKHLFLCWRKETGSTVTTRIQNKMMLQLIRVVLVPLIPNTLVFRAASVSAVKPTDRKSTLIVQAPSTEREFQPQGRKILIKHSLGQNLT